MRDLTFIRKYLYLDTNLRRVTDRKKKNLIIYQWPNSQSRLIGQTEKLLESHAALTIGHKIIMELKTAAAP